MIHPAPKPMTFGSLFAGIGGLDLGLERAGMACEWQVEIDGYCTKVLEKHWLKVKRYRDVKEAHGVFAHAKYDGLLAPKVRRGFGDATDYCEKGAAEASEPSGVRERQSTRDIQPQCPNCLAPVDLICGGFPCQPVSVAGQRKGDADERWLWPEFYRIICELRPRWVLVENVPGLVSVDSGRLFAGILRDLAEGGYDAEWNVLSAAGVGAPHLRKRVFIVAYAQSQQDRGVFKPRLSSDIGADSQDVADTSKHRLEGAKPVRQIWQSPSDIRCSWWAVEPNVGRVAHGIPSRVDRLKSLGNAVVPQVAEWIGRRILESDTPSP